MVVFLDSDVIISSLLSSSGAAYYLLHQSQINPTISSLSVKELQLVVKRLEISATKLEQVVRERCIVLPISRELSVLRQEYEKYVTDVHDAHIVAEADLSDAKYLISYNLKHFKTEKIKEDLDILAMTPALFLQYLRSR